MPHDIAALVGPAGVTTAAALRGRVDAHTIGRWLPVWRVLPPAGPVHVSVPRAQRALAPPGLVVHRVSSLPADRLGPFPVTDLARSLVDAWAGGAGARARRRTTKPHGPR